jgi:hypothetical protein
MSTLRSRVLIAFYSIIAIMLGRLRMTIPECIKAYTELSKAIFTPRHSRASPVRGVEYLNGDGKFDSLVLEREIKNQIRKSKVAKNDDQILLQDPESPCKVYVTSENHSAILSISNGSSTVAYLHFARAIVSLPSSEPTITFTQVKRSSTNAKCGRRAEQPQQRQPSLTRYRLGRTNRASSTGD